MLSLVLTHHHLLYLDSIILDYVQYFKLRLSLTKLQVLKCTNYTAKQWKRMVTKATFVGPGFTRKPPKYERFIRPSGLRFTKAHVTHPELRCTFCLEIIGIKKNPNGPMYTSLGVMTRGTIIEVSTTTKIHIGFSHLSHMLKAWIGFQVNVSELGLVTPAGKVVWGKWSKYTEVLCVIVSLTLYLHLFQGNTLKWQTIQRMMDVLTRFCLFNKKKLQQC